MRSITLGRRRRAAEVAAAVIGAAALLTGTALGAAPAGANPTGPTLGGTLAYYDAQPTAPAGPVRLYDSVELGSTGTDTIVATDGSAQAAEDRALAAGAPVVLSVSIPYPGRADAAKARPCVASPVTYSQVASGSLDGAMKALVQQLASDYRASGTAVPETVYVSFQHEPESDHHQAADYLGTSSAGSPVCGSGAALRADWAAAWHTVQQAAIQQWLADLWNGSWPGNLHLAATPIFLSQTYDALPSGSSCSPYWWAACDSAADDWLAALTAAGGTFQALGVDGYASLYRASSTTTNSCFEAGSGAPFLTLPKSTDDASTVSGLFANASALAARSSVPLVLTEVGSLPDAGSTQADPVHAGFLQALQQYMATPSNQVAFGLYFDQPDQSSACNWTLGSTDLSTTIPSLFR